jgi:cysteinyl-tRNA synthetase
MTLKLHNTLSGKLEEFESLEAGVVKMYHCGPTVYGPQHIGNLSMFVFTDILRRTFEYSDLSVRQVINFTDFGHLVSDGDEGEDKMTKGLKREGLELNLENMLKMGKTYSEAFLADIKKLNVKTEGTRFPYASEYVPEQIEMVKILGEKGFTYETSDGIYFDTSKYAEYGKLGGLSGGENQNRVMENTEKKNPKDFALWKFNEMGWNSDWGKGFPGWHIECSAMIKALLGDEIDVHTGGIEHIPVHHNNEIAQSENSNGKPLARFWLHRSHLQVAGEKIAKSEGNTIYLAEIVEKGFSPLAFRYFLLNSTYRTATSFTWEGLEAANNAFEKLKRFVGPMSVMGEVDLAYKAQFAEKLGNDLNTPQALAVLWTLVKDKEVTPENKLATILDFDKVLGLGLK